MLPADQPATALSTPDGHVILFGLLNAVLMAAGVFFQKLNGVRGGGQLWSGWLLLSLVCFAPTFPIANRVFLAGGRMSLFVPMSAMTYVLSMIAGRLFFAEAVPSARWAGCAVIVFGVALIARG